MGSLALEYQTRDGSGSFYVKDVLSNLYYYSDEELREVLADMIMGTANENLGVQFYQNVTGSFVDTSKIGGLPMEEYFTKERNVTYVPGAGTDEFYEVARTNLIYSQGISFSQGFYEPKN